MSHPNPICRLCANPGPDCKSLYDNKGLGNWLYDWVYKTFHPGIVNMEENKDVTVICEKCRNYISEFLIFKSLVIEGQLKIKGISIKMEKDCSDSEEELSNDITMDIEIKEEFMTLPCEELAGNVGGLSSFDDDNDNVTVGDNNQLEFNESEDEYDSNNEDNIPTVEDDSEKTCLEQQNAAQNQTIPSEPNNSNEGIADPWIPNIKCVVCSQIFCGYSAYRVHFRQEHSQAQFHIMCCNHSMRFRWQFDQHTLYHNNPKAFQCKKCDLCFFTARTLQVHADKRHPESETNKNHKCEICGKGYAKIWGLEQHYQQRHGPKPNTDTQGGPSSSGSVASTNEQFVCSVCHKSFRTKKRLYAHFELIHRNDVRGKELSLRKEFACNNCEKSFCNVRALIRHSVREHGAGMGEESKDGPKMVEVSAEKSSYVCDLCQKGFYNEEALYVHLSVIHNITRDDLQLQEDLDKYKFICDICTKCFMTQAGLCHHQVMAHRKNGGAQQQQVPAEPKIICQICKQIFKEQKNLNLHMARRHNDQVAPYNVFCDKCNKGFYDHRGLKIHRAVMHKTEEKSSGNKEPKPSQNQKSMSTIIKQKKEAAVKSLAIISKAQENLNEVRVEKDESSPTPQADDSQPENLMPKAKRYITQEKVYVDEPSTTAPEEDNLPSASNNIGIEDTHAVMQISQPKLEIMDVGSSDSGSDSVSESDTNKSESSSDDETLLVNYRSSAAKDRSGRKLSKDQRRKSENTDKLVAKFMPNMKCVLCPQIFQKLSLLREHFWQHHPDDTFYFSCCYLKLTQLHLIANHVRLHLDPEIFKCVHCDRNYSNKGSLRRHIYDQHSTTMTHKFSCRLCSGGFMTRLKLKLHYNTHHKDSIKCADIKHCTNRQGLAKKGLVMAPCVRCPRKFIHIGKQLK